MNRNAEVMTGVNITKTIGFEVHKNSNPKTRVRLILN